MTEKEYQINNPEAKEQVELKAKHLDRVVEQGNRIEKETQGENPNWKAVKDLHVGKAPVDKILFEDKSPAKEIKDIPQNEENETPEISKEEIPVPEAPKENPPQSEPEVRKEEPTPEQPELEKEKQPEPKPATGKEKEEKPDYKGYTHRL